MENDSPKNGWLILVALCCLTMALVHTLAPREWSEHDTYEYLRIVTGSPSEARGQWAYRILVPYIVRALPVEHSVGFFIVTYGSTLIILLALFQLLRQLGLTYWASALTVQLAATSYQIALYLGLWGMVDPLSNAFAVLALLCLTQERFLLAGLAVAIGCLAKETAMLVLPLLAWHLVRRGWIYRGVFVVLIPLTVFALQRILITPSTGSVHSLAHLIAVAREWYAFETRGHGVILHLGRDLVKSFGFFWIAALLGFRHQRRWRAESIYLLAAGAAVCVIGSWARSLSWGFVGVFIPVATLVERILRTTARLPLLVGLFALALLQCWLALMGWDTMAPAYRPLYIAGTIAVFLAGGALCWLADGWAGWELEPGPAPTPAGGRGGSPPDRQDG